jgi:energy-coupling factor transport system permease protein
MLLVFSTGMALALPPLLLGGLALLLILYVLAGSPAPGTLLLMIKRLRWLFIAILLVYGWWTPGTPVLPLAGTWSPTYAGLYHGATRILVLLTIVTAVHLLLQSTPRKQLLPAIMQLIYPFTSTRVRERLAVRMLLVIETVPRVQALTAEVLNKRSTSNGALARLSDSSRRLYRHVLDDAAQAQTGTIEISPPTRPPAWQWLIPLAMSGVILGVSIT